MSVFVQFLNTNNTNWNELINNETFNVIVNSAPEYDCANFEGIRIMKWNDLKIQDMANKARAGGVDSNNINNITSELQRGYRTTELPPTAVILPDGSIQLWDGYNRYNACSHLGIEDFPFLVYSIKKSWAKRVDDAYDIISLSANNHTASKRHTTTDFINLGICYCKRKGNNLSKAKIREWVEMINNTFTQKQIDSIVDKIYHQTTIAVNILPFAHPKTAHSKVAEIVDNAASTNPVVICCKEKTYIERGFLQIMQNFVENDIDMTDVVIYTKGCESAEEVLEQRKEAVEYLKVLDELVLQYAVKRMTKKNSSYDISGALPQLTGIEDPQELVELDL